jgi:hypothetical protein
MYKDVYKGIIMLKIRYFVCLIVILISCFFQNVFAAPENELKNIYPLNELLFGEQIVLRGYHPSETIYLPLPKLWNIRSIKLHLVLIHSPLLRSTSTITAEIAGIPVSTMVLNHPGNDAFSWDITIPPNKIKGDVIAVSLMGYLRVTDDVCADWDNPGNWVRILKESHIEYNFDERDYTANLSRFPFPFVQKQSLSPDVITLLLPSSLSLKTFSPVFYMSSLLGNQATWRGVQLNPMRYTDFKNSEKQNTNLLLMGIAAEISDFTKSQAIKIPEKIAADTGIILLFSSPWSPKRALLTITGGNAEALEKAVHALSQPLSSVIKPFENVAFIAVAPTLTRDPYWQSITLKKLGYEDQFVYGTGQWNLHNIVDLSGNKIPAFLKLKIKFGHSPLFHTPDSFLTLRVNGIPQGGVRLDASNEIHGIWNVTVPGTDLTAGKNDLNFLFDLRLSDEACKRYFRSNGWGVIYSDTVLHTQFKNQLPRLTLQQFSAPFSRNSILILPSSNAFYNDKKIVEALLQLGVQMKILPQHLALISSDDLTAPMLKTHNAIFVGTSDEKWISQIFESLEKSAGKKVSPANQALGKIALLPSPWNPQHAVLVIAGANQNALLTALNVLITEKKQANLLGNIAFVNQEGRVIVVDTQKEESYQEWVKKFPLYQIIISISALLIVLLMIVAIILYVIRRKKKEKR